MVITFSLRLHSPVLNQLLEFAFDLMIQTFKQPNQMKKIITCLVLFSILINCQESKENIAENKFSKNVGQQIPNDVAERWAERFKKTNASGRIDNFSLNISILQSFLESPEDMVGVSFHHAIDNHGQYHILATRVNEGEPPLTSAAIDVNEGPIGIATAQDWALRYKTENPHATWSHFFGIYVFERIFLTSDAEQIDLVQGTDDLGRGQLLMYVWSSPEYAGRTQGEELTVYDKSVVCPPDCGASVNNDN
jgi:hypothetical protein